MSTAYELHGRIQQKQRTREALVDAARTLVARGLAPTVEEAATAASISRTTAYRYFGSQAALLAAAHPETVATSLLPGDPPGDGEARLAIVAERFGRLIVGTEAQQRTMLRLSLEAEQADRGDLPLRQGRAIGWIEEALEPDRGRLGDAGVRRLAIAIRSAIGIEALVWLVDVAGLTRDDAIELTGWTARSLYRAALAGA